MILYHFTCADHGAPGIDRTGFVRPPGRPHPAGLPPIVWLTDDPDIDPAALGIADPARAVALSCDRTAVRYTVDGPSIPWIGSSFRARAADWYVADIEDATCGADPTRWFVCRHPLRVLDRVEAVRS